MEHLEDLVEELDHQEPEELEHRELEMLEVMEEEQAAHRLVEEAEKADLVQMGSMTAAQDTAMVEMVGVG